MKKALDRRFLRDSGVEAFDGNELLVKGALETEGGVHLLTGYPGSPVATFFDTMTGCADLLKEHGIEGRMANNEALAVASVNGSQMAPLRAMVVFKSVGLHVASDALALGNLAGPHPEGGAVVVVGDDPWSESTQVPADSRFLFRHLFVPIIEPSTPQEIKDFVGKSFELSRRADLYMGYIITTTLADGGGTVTCRPNHYPLTNTNHRFELQTDALNLQKTVLLPPRTGRSEVDMPNRFQKLFDAAVALDINRFEDVPGNDEMLIVTSGMAYQYVHQALVDFKMADALPVLKLGITYPLDPAMFEPLLDRFRHIVVIEERRSFIEDQITEIALRYVQRKQQPIGQVWGKQFPGGQNGLPAALGLNTSIVADRLGRFLQLIDSPLMKNASAGIKYELKVIADASSHEMNLPARTPTFCPGCPHRDSSSLLLDMKHNFIDPQYMKKHHRRGPIDLVFHGDTGCYTMLMFEPTSELMHNYSGMGLGAGTGSGIDPFITNKQVVFMGDGTFFHSGQLAISNALFSRQDITFIILQNNTTAMTGHQPLAALDLDLLNRPIPAQDIEEMVRAITDNKARVARVDPGDRNEYRKVLEETIIADGVKVIIADKECGITHNRKVLRAERAEQAKKGYLRKKVHMNITPEVCEFCLECSNSTGCPGLNITETAYGPKMATDLSWCVNDGACAKIGACPSFEEVIITRKRQPGRRGHQIMMEDIPEPKVEFKGDIWRAWMAGVGGMGIGTAASILVIAGRHEGFEVQFSDKKGLAIRNGGVYSQIIFSKSKIPTAMTVGYGKADLMIGVDVLEAARAADGKGAFRVASRERTAAVVNVDRTPTIRTLMGLDEFSPTEVEAKLREAVRPDRFFSTRVSSLCERIFGTKLYANITMLGIAYQLGLMPVSLEAMKEGIRQTIRADFRKNLRAFDLGRKLVSHPHLFSEDAPVRTLAQTVREKAAYLNMRLLGKTRALRSERPGAGSRRRLPDTKQARAYKHMVYTTLRACRELDRDTMRAVAVRAYDLIQWGGIRYAQRYVQRVRRVFIADHDQQNFNATRAVIYNLAKSMLIKDEFYVATLLTSYEKLRRDRQRYNVNPSNGDRIRYRRVFHPRWFDKQFDVPVPTWGLYVLRNMRFLRKILPIHFRREREFLKWYEGLVDNFENVPAGHYDTYVDILKSAESVTGFAEIRWPKMEAVRSKAEHQLANMKAQKSAGKGSDVAA